MRDRTLPIHQNQSIRQVRLGLLTALLLCFIATQAGADVFGRLRITVKNAADEKPIANAKIVLKDSANVRGNITLTTDANGIATSPQLETRAWQISTEADTFTADTKSATVAADT